MNTLSRTRDYSVRRSDRLWVILNGLAAIVLGIFMVTNPAVTITALVTALGFFWLATGVITLVSFLWNRENMGWRLTTGVLGVLAGLFIVQNPLLSAVIVPATAALWLGILGIVIGLSELVQAFRGGGVGFGILAVLSIVAGVLLVTRPAAAGLTLAVVLGYFFIIDGVLSIIAALTMRERSEDVERRAAYSSMSMEGVPVTGSELIDEPGAEDYPARGTGPSPADPSEKPRDQADDWDRP
ncbi:MAG TPA: HdeD family acid-resistance protein [Chloroflexi bacterium]|nr:HdeD family acid-resistance protein [Chloroflexota bacterium]